MILLEHLQLGLDIGQHKGKNMVKIKFKEELPDEELEDLLSDEYDDEDIDDDELSDIEKELLGDEDDEEELEKDTKKKKIEDYL